MWVAHGGKGWLNGDRMAEWMEKVYCGHIQDQGQLPSSTLLFMDNCSAHLTEECMATAERLHIPWHTLPPHMTPLLQPLDQYVNSWLKKEYGRCWEEWFEGAGGDRKTKHGNAQRATTDEVNVWIATALHTISIQLGQQCWEHTTDAKPHLVRVPQRAWELILSYWRPAYACVLPFFHRMRAELTAKGFVFPDKVRAAGYVPYQPPWGRVDADDVMRPVRTPPSPDTQAMMASVAEKETKRRAAVVKRRSDDAERKANNQKKRRVGNTAAAAEPVPVPVAPVAPARRPAVSEEVKEATPAGAIPVEGGMTADGVPIGARGLYIALHMKLSEADPTRPPVIPRTLEGRIELWKQLSAQPRMMR